ncbi:uncharacterized protein LOC144447863 [Glandiceps talaboti]
MNKPEKVVMRRAKNIEENWTVQSRPLPLKPERKSVKFETTDMKHSDEMLRYSQMWQHVRNASHSERTGRESSMYMKMPDDDYLEPYDYVRPDQFTDKSVPKFEIPTPDYDVNESLRLSRQSYLQPGPWVAKNH